MHILYYFCNELDGLIVLAYYAIPALYALHRTYIYKVYTDKL